VIQRDSHPDYVRIGNEETDKLMQRAIQKAQATCPQFIEVLQHPKPEYQTLSFKMPFSVHSGGREHIWIVKPSWDGKQLSGTVGNDPVDTTEVQLGQIIHASTDPITDWMYVENNILHGGYTIRVLYHTNPPQTQKAMNKDLGFKIPEIDF
tara:strand:+ start:63 stop:515 length:453 start_codon:yes stop_codon:yes gene_type:complete